MKGRLSVLRANIEADRVALQHPLADLRDTSLEGSATKGDLALVAVALHNVYVAMCR